MIFFHWSKNCERKNMLTTSLMILNKQTSILIYDFQIYEQP
jgi:hypothetical protein